jgi:hypothetical protein
MSKILASPAAARGRLLANGSAPIAGPRGRHREAILHARLSFHGGGAGAEVSSREGRSLAVRAGTGWRHVDGIAKNSTAVFE